MEELLAYAYLLGVGLPVEALYEEKLNELFLADPDCEDYLELELLSGDLKASILYLRVHMDGTAFDRDRFGKALMALLKPLYQSMELKTFASYAYSLWETLAGPLQQEEPFWTLCYADDPLSWGDEAQTRALYEKMFSFYQPE